MTTKTKGQNTMTKIKENMAIFFAIVFIMSMVGATGAVEADNYLVGFIMALVGISTGILTLILQFIDFLEQDENKIRTNVRKIRDFIIFF